LSRYFRMLLGWIPRLHFAIGRLGLFPLGYIKASHPAKAFGHNMTLLLLGVLGLLNICRWLRPLGHGFGFLGLGNSLFCIREYKKSCTRFNPRTKPKWPTQGQDAKKMPTLSQNVQKYSNPRSKFSKNSNTRPKCLGQTWFSLCSNFVAQGLTLGQNSFILNPCFLVCGLGWL
jgi:hypothetical protein